MIFFSNKFICEQSSSIFKFIVSHISFVRCHGDCFSIPSHPTKKSIFLSSTQKNGGKLHFQIIQWKYIFPFRVFRVNFYMPLFFYVCKIYERTKKINMGVELMEIIYMRPNMNDYIKINCSLKIVGLAKINEFYYIL